MVLHWLIALAIIGEIALGWRMDGPPGATTFAVYQLHKSIGITILTLTLIRVAWRLTHRPPPTVGGVAWEHRLAGLVHVGFYVLLLAIPLSGWLIVSASRTGVATILYGLIPLPHIPGIAALAPASKAAVETWAERAHGLLGWAMIGLLALHVLGALKHHLIDRDNGFARMLPGATRVRLLDPRLIAVAVVLAVMAVAGTTYPWIAAKAPAPAPVAAETAIEAPLPTTTPAATLPEAAGAQAEDPVAKPSTWRVQRAASSLSFSTTQGGSQIRGRFTDWTADIVFSPQALEASRVRVTVVMSSFTTEDDNSRGVLGGAEWFDTASNPSAVFTADRFTALGGDRYEARGTLRLKGVSRPATLRFALTIDGDTARMSGSATLDRTAFGVGTGEWAGTDDIPASVSVQTEIRATRVGD